MELTQAVHLGPSAEVIMQALVAVRKMNILFGAASKGSQNLVSLVKDTKRRTNVKIGGVICVGTVVAILGAVGIGGQVAVIIGGVVASLGAGTLAWRKFCDDPRFEKSELCRIDTTPFHHADRCISSHSQSFRPDGSFRPP
jgi:hypothetical protein